MRCKVAPPHLYFGVNAVSLYIGARTDRSTGSRKVSRRGRLGTMYPPSGLTRTATKSPTDALQEIGGAHIVPSNRGIQRPRPRTAEQGGFSV